VIFITTFFFNNSYIIHIFKIDREIITVTSFMRHSNLNDMLRIIV